MSILRQQKKFSMAGFNEKEKKAFRKKIEMPDKIVFCPTCGKKIEYKDKGSATVFFCEGETHLRTAIRGI